MESAPLYQRFTAIASERTLSYADVTLIPQLSDILSRREEGKSPSTATIFARDIHMQLPIVAANMDTVVGVDMAIAMAKNGGIAVLPRFNHIEEEAKAVAEIKKAVRLVIEQPFSLANTLTIGEARTTLDQEDVGGALVRNSDGEVLGLITMRDVLLAEDETAPISTEMASRAELITADINISMEEARRLLHKHRIEKLPLTNADGDIVAMITTRGILDQIRLPYATRDKQGRLAVAAAIGIQRDDLERAAELVAKGADVIVVDVAHGHHAGVIFTVEEFKKRHPTIPVVGGNIVTAAGANDLINAGADVVKVGVGPGALCTTRKITGHGEGQLSAVILVAAEAKRQGVALIADGGIQDSGDIVKALAAGADSIMTGTMLIGTAESPARRVRGNDGIIFKAGRGMSSRDASSDKDRITGRRRHKQPAPEGISALVPYYGPVAELLDELQGGIQSGMSYSGARTIFELQQKGEFKIVGEGYNNESHARAGRFGGYS